MENAARAVIKQPMLLLPLVVLLIGVALVEAPQVVLLGAGAAWAYKAWRRRRHRFDPFVSAMLRDRDAS